MIAAAKLLRPIACCAAALAAAPIASCGDDEAAPRAAERDAAPLATSAEEDAPPVEKQPAKKEALAKGRHAVFGLRMPQGTVPTGKPMPGVYRFEGPSPAALVERFLTTQLESFDRAAEEPSAELIRNAVVRHPVGGSATGPLAIRVHDRPGGAAVDVWLEQEVAGGAPAPSAGGNAQAGDAFAGAPSGAAKKPAGKKYATAAERRRATFEMLQKIERKEPITKEDLDNPLFQ
ncbi:MAG: hypothetical protein M0R80_12170 [Proteobacteria bacterium]|jgi:hypothetical protein|nr:hypothetical protein [Pseudomonadota bacterium]